MIYGMSSDEELLELRQVLDSVSIRMAIEKITEEQMLYLERNIVQMKEAVRSGNMDVAQQFDLEFHMMLIESTNNAFLIRLLKGVYIMFKQSIFDNIQVENIDSKAVYYHEEMLQCIRDKNYEDVDQVVKDSLSTWRNRLK